MTKERYHQLGGIILDSCIAVHRELGPGLLESVYTFALLKEFDLRQIKAAAKTGLPLLYKGYDTGKHYEMDILVEGEIIIEIKSAEVMHPVFMAQIISYLKLSGKKLGYLVNFNVPKMTDGFKRVVNNF
jgi:GxxExxY protein